MPRPFRPLLFPALLYDRGIGGSIGLQPPDPFPPRSLPQPDGRGESAEIYSPTTDEESYGFALGH